MKNSENDAVKEVEKKAKDVKVIDENEEQEKNNKSVSAISLKNQFLVIESNIN